MPLRMSREGLLKGNETRLIFFPSQMREGKVRGSVTGMLDVPPESIGGRFSVGLDDMREVVLLINPLLLWLCGYKLLVWLVV